MSYECDCGCGCPFCEGCSAPECECKCNFDSSNYDDEKDGGWEY